MSQGLTNAGDGMIITKTMSIDYRYYRYCELYVTNRAYIDRQACNRYQIKCLIFKLVCCFDCKLEGFV